jgi:hypothetical protein
MVQTRLYIAVLRFVVSLFDPWNKAFEGIITHPVTTTSDQGQVKGSVCLPAFTPVCSTSPNLDPCRCDSSIRAVSRRQMFDPRTTELQEPFYPKKLSKP